MREIILPMSDDEFKNYLSGIGKKVKSWKDEGLGYISVTCQLAKEVSSEDPGFIFTSGQLKEIFDLAK